MPSCLARISLCALPLLACGLRTCVGSCDTMSQTRCCSYGRHLLTPSERTHEDASGDVTFSLQAFKTTDKKRTGTIAIKSLKDILETIQKSPLTNQQFYLITADADVESSGQLEFGEYMTVRRCRSSCKHVALMLDVNIHHWHGTCTAHPNEAIWKLLCGDAFAMDQACACLRCSAAWPGRSCGPSVASV